MNLYFLFPFLFESAVVDAVVVDDDDDYSTLIELQAQHSRRIELGREGSLFRMVGLIYEATALDCNRSASSS